MYNVLLIDDEPIIRKGLKNIINWKQYGCRVCGEAADGLEGRRMIEEFLPEIVITDIRMPGTDGLTMIREIKQLIPKSKIIILTGYRDFDYVQEALKLGAFDFILKPSKIEELASLIGRTVRELEAEEREARENLRLKELFEQNMPVLREKLIYDLAHEIISNERDIKEKMKLFGLDINRFIFIVVEVDNEEEDGTVPDQYEYHLYRFGIINTFEEVFSDTFSITTVSLDDRDTGFLISNTGNLQDYEDVIDKKCLYLQKIISDCFGFTVTIAVSSPGEGPMQLPMKLKECRNSLHQKFFIGNNSIIFYNDVSSFFSYDDISALERNREILLDAIKSGNEKITRAALHDIGGFINSFGNAKSEYFKNFYRTTLLSINDIKLSVLAADNKKEAEDRDYSSLYRLIEECGCLNDLQELLVNISLGVVARISSYNSQSVKLVLRKALEYLQDNYSKQITLNDVAKHTYVSIYYLSRIFTRELGKGFVDCLNEIRIGKAKELLKNVKYKTCEVAEMVGIPDAHYFSRLFKKYEGITPTEYRDSNA
jgi:two-component system response regulator YesN